MNERQRDLFLWLWSRRRQRGAAQVARRGALIGAGGGLLFCVVMLASMGAPDRGAYTGLAAILPMIERVSMLFAMTVPPMALMGFFKARRIFNLHERMYQSMLQQGASVPATRPVLRTADRWPAMAVGLTVLVIAGFIGYLLWAASNGRL